MRIGIIGAGFSGIALALGAKKLGIDAIIVEHQTKDALLKSESFDMILTGPTLRIFDEITSAGPSFRHHLPRTDFSGFVTLRPDLSAVSRIHQRITQLTDFRGNHISELLDSLPHNQIYFDTEVTEILDHGDHCAIVLKSGKSLQCDLIVGCDGAHSIVRKRLGHSVERNYFGYYFIGGRVNSETLAHSELSTDAMSECWHPNGRLGWCAAVDSQVFVYAILKDPQNKIAQKRDRSDSSKRSIILEQLGGIAKPLQSLVQAMEITYSAPIYTGAMAPLPWGKGLITLAGDSAHPIIPSLATGALLAVEDVNELLKTLEQLTNEHTHASNRRSESIKTALRQYEKKRHFRSRAVKGISENLYRLAIRQGLPLGQTLNNALGSAMIQYLYG